MENKNKTTTEKMELAILEMNDNTFAVYDENDEHEKLRFTTTSSTITLFNALNGVSIPLKKYIGTVINVTDVVIGEGLVLKDRDNEEAGKEYIPCIHLFTDNGEHISTLSKGFCNSISNLIECGIIPTPETPIKILVKEEECKKGKMHTFDLV